MQPQRHDLQHLLEESGPALHRLFYRVTLRTDVAEDLLHDLFVRLSTSTAFQACEDPKAYAMRAAVHLAIDWRRASRLPPPPAAAPAEPSGRPERSDEFERILEGVMSLRGLMREAVILRYLHGADYRAIGAALDRTPHQARALCRKGVARLVAKFREKGTVPCQP